MRLLHSTDLKFREIFEHEIPKYPYAILSHRWGSLTEEVSYEEFLAGKKDESPGLQKIKSFCKWAAASGYKWVWIDTCCIDKRSSAELSEAINSMYAWYKQSSLCVVYLRDTFFTTDDLTEDDWFTRGWTLQELIAPPFLVFVTTDWQVIGWKSEPRIASAVSSHTGISRRVLAGRIDIKNVSVARRMSWMANRTTSNVEDMAYCLLGIFDVNMPLLYGEKCKAFQRLQLEILEQYEDESIFAWSMQEDHAADSAFHGLLAKTPSQFARCGNVVAMYMQHEADAPPVTANARTVQFCAGLLPSAGQNPHGNYQPVFLHQLRCAYTSNPKSHLDVYVSDTVVGDTDIRPCFIALSRKSGTAYSRVMARHLPWNLASFQDSQSLLRLERKIFRARTSFSVESIIDRVYSGNRTNSHQYENYANETSAPARVTTSGVVSGLQTSAPARAPARVTHSGQTGRHASYTAVARRTTTSNAQYPQYYRPYFPPASISADEPRNVMPPPPPPRPNRANAGNSYRNAVSVNLPSSGDQVGSEEAPFPKAVSSNLPSQPPSRSAQTATQSSSGERPDSDIMQWTTIPAQDYHPTPAQDWHYTTDLRFSAYERDIVSPASSGAYNRF